MRGGPCGDVFRAWEACVDDCRDGDDSDFVEVCSVPTRLLKLCMDDHPEYYGMINDSLGTSGSESDTQEMSEDVVDDDDSVTAS